MENIDFSILYDEKAKNIMKTAEDSLDTHTDRVHEIISFAKESKIKSIGIANCTAFLKEADQLEKTLTEAGFHVEKVHCKYGKLAFNQLVPEYEGISCNPAGQAKYLEDKDTELNIMMGLCLGHDMIFNARSKAPVTPLLVKDRKLKHHTLEFFRDEKLNDK